MKHKLIRITTVPISLQKLLAGQMKFMSRHGFDVVMISSDFEGKEELEVLEEAVYIPVNMTRRISPFTDLKSLVRLIFAFQKLRPSIVHTHTPKAGLLGMLAAKIVNVPVRLHTVAGLPLMEAKGAKKNLLKVLERLTYACATKVYPNSNKLKEFILESKFTEVTKLKVIGNGSSNGIDTETFSRSKAIDTVAKQLLDVHQLSETNFTFIFVGRLVRDKGIHELVEAFSKLSLVYPLLRLLLVGPEEPDLDPLSAECLREIRHNPSIIHVGFQSDIRPYLSISKVLVFPSYREGFPNVPMQAGCFDLPAIVSDINGCNEIIQQNMNGFIIPVKNTAVLQEAMENIYNDSSLYEVMSENARRMIVERFEQIKIWNLLKDEYTQHLNKV